MKNFYIFIFLFINTILINSQTIPTKTLDSLFTQYEKKDKLFGSAELLKNNRVLYKKSIGWQNIWKKHKNDSLTVYPIGIITELFVQTLLFQFVEEGKIKLSNKLSSYYKEIPNSEQITVENLLRHTSSLKSADSLYTTNSREKIIQYLQKNSEPKKNNHSNLDYLLLGFILEDISGENFHDLLKKRIIDKINLENTFYGEKPAEEHLALSYYKKDNDWKKNYNQDIEYFKTDAGIYSTPHDLNMFISALYSGKLLSKKITDTYFKENKENRIKIGLYQEKDKTIGGYYITSKLKGFQVQLRYFDKENISLCTISNANDNMNQNFLTDALSDAVHNKPIKFPNFSLVSQWTGQP